MKKILIIATVQSHIAQFHKKFIKSLQKDGFVVHVAARNNLDEKDTLKLSEPNKIFDLNFSRSPFSLRNLKVLRELRYIINNENYDIIHCHTPMGGVLGRMAAKKARRSGTKVIYTSHGFHFYKGSPIINWMLYYPIEKILSNKTDAIITINQEDYMLAKKKFKKSKVYKVNGVGIDEERFNNFKPFDLRSCFPKVKKPYILTTIGELNDNKNQLFLINSMRKITKMNPDIVLVLVGDGPNYIKYKNKIHKYDLQDNIIMLGYRRNIAGILNETDLLISASKREGLPMNLIEAIIMNKKIIASNIRGHKDIVVDPSIGSLFELENQEHFIETLMKKYNIAAKNNNRDDYLKRYIRKFSVSDINKEIKDIYRAI